MGLWMLSFGDRGTAIIEAETMIHARLRIAVNGLVRASLLIGGCQIDPEFIPLIPDEPIGRELSRGRQRLFPIATVLNGKCTPARV